MFSIYSFGGFKIAKAFTESLLGQFTKSWNLFQQTIDKVDESNWFQLYYQNSENYWCYALTLYHILETSEFYIRSNPEGMEWGKRGNIQWDKSNNLKNAVKTITMNLIIEYQTEVQQSISSFLKNITDSQILEQDDFTWFPSIFDKLLYLLRHNLMHLGEINKYLRDLNLPRLSWE